ncbi:MAG: periplasmic heavy metal sensor [Verrucomicrobiota bacterium]
MVVILSSTAAYLAGRFVTWKHERGEALNRQDDYKGMDLHTWMHEQLEINEDQWSRLGPYEEKFEDDRKRLLKELSAGGEALAKALGQGDREASDFKQALERVNQAQAELQELTLDHFFVMKEHLDPAQAARLIEWTHDSITHHHDH